MYDLAGTNVSGIYDLSHEQRMDRDQSDDDEIMEKLSCTRWIIIYKKRAIMILIILMICLIIGIGVPRLLIGEVQGNTATDDSLKGIFEWKI